MSRTMDSEDEITSRFRAVDATVGNARDALCRLQDELESGDSVGDAVYRRVVEAYHANLRLAVAMDVLKAERAELTNRIPL